MPSAAKRPLFELVRHDDDLGIMFRDVTGRALQYPWHFHPELELTHVVKGSGVRYVGDSIEQFEDGDLCLIGASTPHCWLTEVGRSDPIHARVIQFLPESIAASWSDSLTYRPLSELFARARRGLLIRGACKQRTLEAMRALFVGSPRPLDRFVGLLAILADLSASDELAELSLGDGSVPDDNGSAEVASRLLGYIHEHAADAELSFSGVARACGMSRATLGRAFPRLFGKTFVKYLSEVRVTQACTLLTETGRSVSEIALGTGFGSLSNFNRQFRALKQTTPLRYRRSTIVRDVRR
ncbi:MAG: AraC family transcriptional regulator [Polyangiaceae bacterium]